MCSHLSTAHQPHKLTPLLSLSPPARFREPIPTPVQGYELLAAARALHWLQESLCDRHQIETSSTDSKREGLRLQPAAERLDAVALGAFGAISSLSVARPSDYLNFLINL